ncbi:hypothetical protein GCM10010404_90760 [Nonomuraea africana]
MPTRSPVGREVRTLDMREEYALQRMFMQCLGVRVADLAPLGRCRRAREAGAIIAIRVLP